MVTPVPVGGDGVRVHAALGQVLGQVAHKFCVALAGLVQLGALAQRLEVGGKGDVLRLLHLEPVDRHLGADGHTGHRLKKR